MDSSIKGKSPDYWTTWQRPSAKSPRWIADAEELVRNLLRITPLPSTARVLDFGCGQGLAAARLSLSVAAVDLWDSSAVAREQAAMVCNKCPNARVLSELPSQPKYDFILVASVTQYMTESELAEALSLWKRLLAPNGRVLVTDIIQPPRRIAREILALLRFTLRNKLVGCMLLETLRGLPSYWRQSKAQPLTLYDAATIEKLAAAAGFAHEWVENPNMFPTRFTALLTPSR